ncbi:MAG: cell division protein ZapB [Candidatus Aminicenantes bacterium]|nr:cell division protein ZapB [Candidatus Aminicenantes bacterium]
MNIEELDKLEGKVNDMVNKLKLLKDENKKLTTEIEDLKKETTLNSDERNQVKRKVAALIELIDSLEQE